MSISKKKKEYDELSKKNERMSYKSWLAAEGIDSASRFEDAMASAEAAKRQALPTYGTKADELLSKGLTDSGYSQYIRAEAEKRTRRDMAIAYDEKERNEQANRSGYADYVNDCEKEQSRIVEELTASIIDGRIYDAERAYALAIEAGLTEENALAVGAEATRKSKDTARAQAIIYATTKHLSANQARYYARSLGLDEKSVNYVLDKIYAMTEDEVDFFSSMSAEEYMDYIKQRVENKNN